MGTPPPRHPPALGDLPYTCPHPTAPEIHAKTPPGDLQLLVYPLLLKTTQLRRKFHTKISMGCKGNLRGPAVFGQHHFLGRVCGVKPGLPSTSSPSSAAGGCCLAADVICSPALLRSAAPPG